MNTVEAITEVITDADLIDATDSEYTAERARVLRALVRTWEKVWLDRAWWFVFAEGSITVPDGVGYVVLPSDFMDFTLYGGAFRAIDGAQMVYKNPVWMKEQKLLPGHTVSNPYFYSIYGQDGTTKEPLFQTEVNSGSAVVKLLYRTEPPTLDESSNSTNLSKMPDQWHRSVLISGTKADIRAPKADALWKKWQNDHEMALRKMRQEERTGRESPSQIQHFFENR